MRPENPTEIDGELTLGDGVAVIRRRGRSQPLVVGVLGVDRDACGEPLRVWLDRLVHEPYHRSMGPWVVSGAISTVFTRRGVD